MVGIQSATAEIRRGKKEEERRRRKKKKKEEEETTGQKYSAPLLHRAAIIMVCSFHRATITNTRR